MQGSSVQFSLVANAHQPPDPTGRRLSAESADSTGLAAFQDAPSVIGRDNAARPPSSPPICPSSKHAIGPSADGSGFDRSWLQHVDDYTMRSWNEINYSRMELF